MMHPCSSASGHIGFDKALLGPFAIGGNKSDTIPKLNF